MAFDVKRSTYSGRLGVGVEWGGDRATVSDNYATASSTRLRLVSQAAGWEPGATTSEVLAHLHSLVPLHL